MSTQGSDPLNCGACNVACDGGDICVQGTCKTPEARCDSTDNEYLCVTAAGNAGDCCLSTCAESLSDPFNCGGCGVACPIGGLCEEGLCITDAGSLAGCGANELAGCPPNTACSDELFVSPCFPTTCPAGSDGILCVLDGGAFGDCCAEACTSSLTDGGC